MGDANLVEAATKFSEAVAATGIIGELKTDARVVRDELNDFKSDMRNDLNEFKSSIRDDISEFKVGVRDDLISFKADQKETQGDVKHIRSTIDRYAGAMVVVGSLVSIAVSVVIAVIRSGV